MKKLILVSLLALAFGCNTETKSLSYEAQIIALKEQQVINKVAIQNTELNSRVSSNFEDFRGIQYVDLGVIVSYGDFDDNEKMFIPYSRIHTIYIENDKMTFELIDNRL